jgi:hypothetical protein
MVSQVMFQDKGAAKSLDAVVTQSWQVYFNSGLP